MSCLHLIEDHIDAHPEICIRYFLRMSENAVGYSGSFRVIQKISALDGTIVMTAGCVVSVFAIINLL